MNVIPNNRVGDRFVAIFMTVMIVLFFALVGSVIYLVVSVSSVQSAQENDNIISCQESNASRTTDVMLWEHLLKLPANATVAQKAAVTRDLVLVHQAYTLRNCESEYG
jgi:hypothetical protein